MEARNTKLSRPEKKIIKNVLRLFELHDDYYWMFTRYIARTFKSYNEIAMDIYQRSISIAVGNRSEFHTWLSVELDNYFSHKLSMDDTIRVSQMKNFSLNLAKYLFEKCAKYSLDEYSFPNGRGIVFKHIVDFIENEADENYVNTE